MWRISNTLEQNCEIPPDVSPLSRIFDSKPNKQALENSLNVNFAAVNIGFVDIVAYIHLF